MLSPHQDYVVRHSIESYERNSFLNFRKKTLQLMTEDPLNSVKYVDDLDSIERRLVDVRALLKKAKVNGRSIKVTHIEVNYGKNGRRHGVSFKRGGLST